VKLSWDGPLSKSKWEEGGGDRGGSIGLNGGLKVRDLGFKPPTGNRACPSRDEAFVERHASVRLSRGSFARNNSEYIQFDEPETVINAIGEVYDQTRRP
jgi:hypothetical protein